MKEMCTQATNVRLPEALKDRALRIAEQNKLSISDLVRISLITLLPEMERGEFRLRGCAGGKV